MPVIQITMSEGRSVEQKRELVKVLTKEIARIMKRENWGNAGILGADMK